MAKTEAQPSSFQVKSTQLAGLLAYSAEAAGSQLDGLFEFWADGPGPGQWRAMRSGHVVHESLGSCGQALGVVTRSWLGLDVPIREGLPGIMNSFSFSLILYEIKDTRPKQRDPPMRNENPSQKGRIRDQNHKGTIRFMANRKTYSWTEIGAKDQGWLAERQNDQLVRAIAAVSADRLDQKGTSRQRLRVAKGHELPKVVRYQRMQVTKSYEIPMVASIKGYEDQRVPMTVHRDTRLRVAEDHVVIQEVRDRKGTNGLRLKVYERNRTEKGTSGSMITRTPNALCWAWTHMMEIGCPTGVGPNLIDECIGWYEQIIYVVWVKSQGRSGQMKTHQFQDLMSFVSPEDGLGTIAYKAKGFRIVHEPRKAICMSQERPYANPQSKRNLSQWRTDELISSIDVAKLDYYLTQLRQLGVSSSQLDGLFEFWANGSGPSQWQAMRSGHVVHESLGSCGQAVGLADRLDQKGTSRQRLRVAKGHELPKVVRYQRMQVTKRYEIPRVASIKGYEDQRVPMTKGCIVIPRMQCIYYVSVSTHRTSVCVCQHTQNVRGCLCVFVCVRVCPSAHKGCLWLSMSTHIITLVLGLSTLTLPVDYSGRLWLSVSTHRTSVAVCVCPCVSVCVRQHTQDIRGCPCVSVSTHRTFVAFRVCPSAHAGRSWMSVSVRVCSSAHTGLPWLSNSTHISTLVLGLSTLALPVDCLGDFGPHGLSVQYTERLWVSVRTHMTSVCVRQHTKDVSGCPCVSVSTHRTSVAVCVCPSSHTGRSWLSVCVNQHTQDVRGCPCVFVTLTLPVDSSGDFGPRGLSVQYTQDVCGCPSAHTDVCGCPPAHIGRLWLSVCVRVYPYPHTGRLWLSISTHISMLVHGFSTLAHPVDCLGDFGQRGLSVQYTQDNRGCPPAHTGRLWPSVSIRQHTQDICGCPSVQISALHTGHPWVSASTHRTSVAIRVCPSAHTRHPWLSISTNISMLVLGLSTLTLTVDCSSDFGPRGLSVQFTHDVRGCPSAHTRRPWLSVCVRVWSRVSVSTHRMSVAVHQYTYQHAGTWTQHAGPSRGLFGTSVGVRQHTQDVRVCLSAHTGRPWLSVCDRVCPSAHTGRPWLSISTHISTLVPALSTLTLPVDCLGDFGPCGLIVQYTQDVRGSPLAHTGRLWLSVAVCQHTQDVCGCPCVSVCVRQHTQDVCGCPSVHISTLVLPVDCFGDYGPRGQSFQYTQDVCGCPPAHTRRPWLSVSTHRTSVAVRVCPCVSVCVRQHTHDVRGCPSVHISARWSLDSARWPVPWTVWVILAHVGCLLSTHMTCVGDRQHTQDVRGCLSSHTERTWVSVCVCGCPPAHTGRPWLSVAVRQHTQDIRLCLSAHTERPCVFVCVRVCPCVSVSPHRTYVAVHKYTYQHAGPWTQHAVPSRGLFGTSVGVRQHTQDVCSYPCVVGTGRRVERMDGRTDGWSFCGSALPWMDALITLEPDLVVGPLRIMGTSVVGTTTPWLSVSTHKTSVAVHQYKYQHVGPWTQHADPSRGLFGCFLAHVGCLFSTHRTYVAVQQHTQDVCGCPCVSVCGRVCPSAHTGRLWLSISTHISMLVLPVDCSGRPWVSASTHRTSVAVCQHTQDVCGCPCVSVNTHRTSVAVNQYTYQHAGPLTQHAGPSCGLFW
ncbi:hypothetical protein IGI04_006104 [Brassica rapa subsp. trilocularis]|uniref:Uncharacterized protein n=1 Tax=Brassica rapa subsp. trilocularis TaxID=1813537 RepID=A0ABQ7NFY2_BRACM|nr:hypothetical protein IGI04_006104 [Brassica rapa subsp. trilocularis]